MILTLLGKLLLTFRLTYKKSVLTVLENELFLMKKGRILFSIHEEIWKAHCQYFTFFNALGSIVILWYLTKGVEISVGTCYIQFISGVQFYSTKSEISQILLGSWMNPRKLAMVGI